MFFGHRNGIDTYIPLTTDPNELVRSFVEIDSPSFNGRLNGTWQQAGATICAVGQPQQPRSLAACYDSSKPAIVFYGGARDGADETYCDLAYKIGRYAAMQGWNGIYGGGSQGTMGAFADGMIENNGKVLGVQPKCFFSEIDSVALNEPPHPSLVGTLIVSDMSARKNVMALLGNTAQHPKGTPFIIGAGGDGTLDELFEAKTLIKLGQIKGNIYVIGTRESIDPIKTLLNTNHNLGFSEEPFKNMFFSTNPTLLIRKIAEDYGYEFINPSLNAPELSTDALNGYSRNSHLRRRRFGFNNRI